MINKKQLIIIAAGLFFFSSFLEAFPKVSVITSLYKGEKFIKSFLENIVEQTIFKEIELIIINANSPENEEKFILPYVLAYPNNIRYIKLTERISIYKAWNLGIKNARAPYLVNANVDDHLSKNFLEIHYKKLHKNRSCGVVYSDSFMSYEANQNIEQCKNLPILGLPNFSIEKLKESCIVGNHPMWRKKLHDQYGLFREDLTVAGDYEMWVRLASQGVTFKKIHGIYGVYYVNPDGLSTDKKNLELIYKEIVSVRQRYSQFFNS